MAAPIPLATTQPARKRRDFVTSERRLGRTVFCPFAIGCGIDSVFGGLGYDTDELAVKKIACAPSLPALPLARSNPGPAVARQRKPGIISLRYVPDPDRGEVSRRLILPSRAPFFCSMMATMLAHCGGTTLVPPPPWSHHGPD